MSKARRKTVQVPGRRRQVPLGCIGRPPVVPRDIRNCRMAAGAGHYLRYRNIRDCHAANTPHVDPARFVSDSNGINTRITPHHCFYLRYRMPRTSATPVIKGAFAPSGNCKGWRIVVKGSSHGPNLVGHL